MFSWLSIYFLVEGAVVLLGPLEYTSYISMYILQLVQSYKVLHRVSHVT